MDVELSSDRPGQEEGGQRAPAIKQEEEGHQQQRDKQQQGGGAAAPAAESTTGAARDEGGGEGEAQPAPPQQQSKALPPPRRAAEVYGVDLSGGGNQQQKRLYWDRSHYESPAAQMKALTKSSTLYVGNLAFSTRSRHVRSHFAQLGPVQSIHMGLDRLKKTPCGKAFYEINGNAGNRSAGSRYCRFSFLFLRSLRFPFYYVLRSSFSRKKDFASSSTGTGTTRSRR